MTADALEGGSPSPDSALDLAVIQGLVDTLGDEGSGLVAGVIDTFLGDAPRLVAAMRAALADETAADVRDAAHSLKSSAAGLGATRLSQACARLEAAAKAHHIAAAAQLLAEVETEHAAARVALQATIATLGPGHRGTA